MKEWLKSMALKLYALGMKGYKAYDALPDDKKKQIEKAVEKTIKGIMDKDD